MANTKFSQIASAPSNFASTDTLVGVRNGTTDYQFSQAQIFAGISAPGSSGDIIYNSSGALAGDSRFTYAGAGGNLTYVAANSSSTVRFEMGAVAGNLAIFSAGSGGNILTFDADAGGAHTSVAGGYGDNYLYFNAIAGFAFFLDGTRALDYGNSNTDAWTLTSATNSGFIMNNTNGTSVKSQLSFRGDNVEYWSIGIDPNAVGNTDTFYIYSDDAGAVIFDWGVSNSTAWSFTVGSDSRIVAGQFGLDADFGIINLNGDRGSSGYVGLLGGATSDKALYLGGIAGFEFHFGSGLTNVADYNKTTPYTWTFATALPGDILTNTSASPVAAHSLARKLFSSYNGNLFTVRRASDNTTLNVGTGSDGYANMSALNTFLLGTTGYVTEIYDQTGNSNHLPQATSANQGKLNIRYTTNGRSIPVVTCESGHYYRNRVSTTNIPVGAVPITVYGLITNNVLQGYTTIGFYGNMETSATDTGNGHMFAIALGTMYGNQSGVGGGPWIGTDWENGIYNNTTFAENPNAPPESSNFITITSKTNGTSSWTLKGGSATSSLVNTIYSGGLPSGYTAHFEGGISLGEGGDTTPGPVEFIEGIICSAQSTDAADNAIQANLNAMLGTGSGLIDSAGFVYTGEFSVFGGDLALSGGADGAGGIVVIGPDSNIAIGPNFGALGYNIVSLNGQFNGSTGLGISGGGTSDNTLYIGAPSSGEFSFTVNGNNVTDYNKTNSNQWTFLSSGVIVRSSNPGIAVDATTTGGHEIFLTAASTGGLFGVAAGGGSLTDVASGNVICWWDAAQAGFNVSCPAISLSAQGIGNYTAPTPDTYLNRQSAGVFGIGTSSTNTSGSLTLAGFTLTGDATYMGSPRSITSSYTVKTGYELIINNRATYTSTQRVTGVGTAQIILTDDFGTRSRIVLH